MGAFTVDLRQVYSLSYLWYILGLTVSGAFYGGLHLTAWANQFPSETEAILWRAAGVTILSAGPVCALFAICF